MNYKAFVSLFLLINLSVFGQKPLIKPYPVPKLLHSPLAQKIYAHRSQIHQNALLNIKNDFNITDSDWHLYMDIVHESVAKDNLFSGTKKPKKMMQHSDHWLIKIAKKVLIECGVNLKRIIITLDNDPQVNGMAVQWFDTKRNQIMHELKMNPDWFAALSSAAECEAVLRHEIMHFAHYDGFEEYYIYIMLYCLDYTQEQIDAHPAIINYRKEREARADLLAVVDKPSLIHAEYKRFSRFAQNYPSCSEESWTTHPSDKTRADNMAQLLAFINSPAVAA